MGFSTQLKLTHDPFGREAPTPILSSVQAAFDEVMREIQSGAPIVVIAGPTGTGKTFLIGLIARSVARNGGSVQRIERGDLANAESSARCDLLLIDEADSTDPVTLQSLLAPEGEKPAPCIVFACRPASAHRFAGNVAPVFVTLRTLSPAEARSFVLERAANAGRRNVFDAAALDALIAASGGSARLLNSLGGRALFLAESEGADRIGANHVEEALRAQFGVQPVSADGTAEEQESHLLPGLETPAEPKPEPESLEPPEKEDSDQFYVLPDQNNLANPIRDSRTLFIVAFAAWLVLISAVLYDKHVSGFLYRTSVSATETAVPRPIANPLAAMQRVADALPHRPIVLTLVSPPPLQQVAFAPNVSPAGKKSIVSGHRAGKRFAASAPRGHKTLAMFAEQGQRLSGSPQAKVAIAQAEARPRQEAPAAEDLSAVDRVRNFVDRHLWVHIEELKLRGED